MDIIQISKDVLIRLTEMDYERKSGTSKERLIFPNKIPSEAKNEEITEKELLKYRRISEQEMRFLFVEQFINDKSNEFFYSVETPTEKKYRFGKTNNDSPAVDDTGRSASIDMCVFKRDSTNYNRILNIEFKHQNAALKNIEKDVLKLMHEEQNGAFILLLKNTDNGTLINNGDKRKGVLDKFCESLVTHKEKWNGGKSKFIQLIILSLEEKENNNGKPFLKYRNISEVDLETIKTKIEDGWKEV